MLEVGGVASHVTPPTSTVHVDYCTDGEFPCSVCVKCEGVCVCTCIYKMKDDATIF